MDKEVEKIVLKTVCYVLNQAIKALPVGTKRKRKGGIYEKQSNGKWVKVKEDKKPDDKKEDKLKTPRDLTQMTPKQNRQFINALKKKPEKELNKRVKIIDAQIKNREKELESQGIDFKRKPDHGLNNLWHNRKLTETAIQEIRDKKIK